MTLEQISIRAAVARRQHVQYIDFVERCELVLQQAHDLGWRVAQMLNDEHSVRAAESLMGAHLKSDFCESTPLSRLIYGF
ncbi:hypothetical protein [Panacagrimonas sp.]|uniref:hypothetical protein n=1 Tax=Panacagrimonas sp. TaxID=2480088 RepID=UPI003B51A6B7